MGWGRDLWILWSSKLSPCATGAMGNLGPYNIPQAHFVNIAMDNPTWPNIDHLRLSSCSSTLGSTARCPRSGLSGLNALRRKNRWPRSVAEKLKKQSVKIVKICEIVKERPSKATALWRCLPCKVFGNPMQSPQSHGRMKMWQCGWPVWRQCEREIAITLEHLFSLLRVNLGAPQVMRESVY